MSLRSRLFACSLRCIASRLSVPDVVLKNTKLSLCGNLLAASRAKCAVGWPPYARVFSNRCSYWQPLVRGYRTAPTRTTGFARNEYDENEISTEDVCVVSGSVIASWFIVVNDVIFNLMMVSRMEHSGCTVYG